jgi:trk system potassium uptake protein TrkH
MSFFDSVCHAFATVATGGFSTKQDSITFWDSAYVEYVLIVFMLLGGTNFALIYYMFRGNFKKIKKNDEFKWYIWAVLIFTGLVFVGLIVSGQVNGTLEKTFRDSLFQVTTIITSCGFSTADYVVWGPYFWILMLMLMVSGACAGSTSGGMKIIRSGTLIKSTLNEFNRQIHPRAILPVRINNSVVPQDIIVNVIIFALVYVLIIVLSTLLLTIVGVGFEESIGAVVSCVGNTGPGLGEIGPAGTFVDLPDFAKWILCFDMIVGRLELFTLLIIFLPGFWKK